jgi:phytol kinase
MNPWLGILAVCLALPISMAVLSGIVRHGLLSHEAARKALHVEMGLVTLSFPWLFTDAWPVVVLAALSIAWFAGVRAIRTLRSSFGPVLETPTRRSNGQFWFVCGVCLAFLLADDRAAYCIAILVMALADSSAALAGTRWGRPRATLSGACKSFAGSAAFFAVAFAVAFAIGASAATALLVALATTFVEALLADGLDNLLVPLAALVACHFAASAGLPVAAFAALALAAGIVVNLRPGLAWSA